jgi:hypothetical protein
MIGTTVAVVALLAVLLPMGVAADTPTGSITGTVHGPAGAPVAGQQVVAQGFPDTSLYYYANTATDGTYTLSGVAAGTYYMAVRVSAGALPTGYVSGSGLTPYGPLASVVTVGTASTTVNVHVPAGYAISGTVTAGGSPLSGIRLFLCGALDGAMPASSVTYCGHATTAADGTYSVAALPGPYTVAFYDSTNTYPFTYYSTAGATLDGAAATILTVTKATIGGIDVDLAKAATFVASIAGRVTDGSSSPLSGIDVDACSAASPAECASATTNTDGIYTVSGLAPGSYTVAFGDPNAAHAGGFYGSSGFTATLAGATPVAVASSAVTGIDVQLPVGHLVKGTVTGPGGIPLGSPYVAPCASPACGVQSVTTGADGTYSLDLAPGSYVLHFIDYSGLYLSGYYATGGLSNAAGATPVTVGSADMTGLNVALHGISASISAGITKKGPFSSGHTLVIKSHGYVTIRVAVGKGFAGSAVQFQVATRSTAGVWTAYKTLISRVVGADGSAYYSLRPVGWMSFRAGVRDPVVSAQQTAGGSGDVEVFSGPVVARGI